MAARPTWSGHLRLSLVTCPVALYNATTTAGDVSFHLINPETGNRIKMITTDPDTGPISRSDLVKGYEVEKGRYVLLTNEEIASVKLESTRVIDIERFVDASEIDRLYWDKPYFLVPDGKLGVEAFAVIREAMERSNMVALGRVVLHTRERLIALEPRGKGLMASTLRVADEVRSAEEVFDSIPDVAADPGMIAIAEKIIEQQHGEFEPATFRDRYEDALRALIAEKEGEAPKKKTPEAKDTNVVDLMAALKASLERQTPTSRPRPAAKDAAPAKAAAKPAGRRAPPKRASR
jgi:DNA end-binding protein Ku